MEIFYSTKYSIHPNKLVGIYVSKAVRLSTPASLSFKGQETKHTNVKGVLWFNFSVYPCTCAMIAYHLHLWHRKHKSSRFSSLTYVAHSHMQQACLSSILVSALNRTAAHTDSYPVETPSREMRHTTITDSAQTCNKFKIDHFQVACLVAWPSNESEAGGDIVLIETFLLFVLMMLFSC